MDQLQSPFAIPREDVEALERSEGFRMLRKYLAGNAEYVHCSSPAFFQLISDSFCDHHDQCDTQAKETWLLHRDILHALIMPIVTLFRRASALAEAALCTDRRADLELAFAGEARGAFVCLQCFLTEENEWSQSVGCPGMYTIGNETEAKFKTDQLQHAWSQPQYLPKAISALRSLHPSYPPHPSLRLVARPRPNNLHPQLEPCPHSHTFCPPFAPPWTQIRSGAMTWTCGHISSPEPSNSRRAYKI